MPYLEKPKATFELPHFYVGPETDFKKMELMCMLQVDFSVSNIGNGPAVAVDFLPMVLSGPRSEKPSILIKETISRRVDCVPSGDRGPKAIEFHFNDNEHKAVEAIVKDYRLLFSCTMVYKNSLGAAFKEVIAFWLDIQLQDDFKTLESSLKTIKTADIDFATNIKKFRELRNAGRKEEADKVFDDTNAQLEKNLGGKRQINLSVIPAWGSFDVSPIAQADYEKLLAKKRELERKDIETIEECWKRDE
jgi:hypothetical protein